MLASLPLPFRRSKAHRGRRVAVVGAGYVGLVTAACLAELGNRITCIDVDPRKVAALQNGTIPFYEPGLRELVLRNQQRRRLDFSSTVAEATVGCEYVFIAVGTPANPDGSCDLSAVHLAARQIGEARLAAAAVVVNKSTVPVGTGDVVARIIQEAGVERNPAMVVSNPEFLREGSAVSDFLQPDRVIIGAGSADAALLMRELYAPLNAPIIVTDVRTAEMIKYAANAFLATKISFINEIADLCEELGADVTGVIAGAGADSRIGMASFNAGLGFGGSCFPKDVSSLMDVAKRSNVPMQLLPAVLQVNRRRVDRVLGNLSAAIGSVAGKRVAVFGLAFKANTDDVRESPALTLIERLLQRGATVAAHDPIAIPGARRVLGDAVEFIDDCYRAANDADALLIATDWAEYRELDFATIKKLMRGSVVVDARNVCDPARVAAAGLQYIGVGHSSRATSLRARTVPPSDSIRTPFPLPAG